MPQGAVCVPPRPAQFPRRRSAADCAVVGPPPPGGGYFGGAPNGPPPGAPPSYGGGYGPPPPPGGGYGGNAPPAYGGGGGYPPVSGGYGGAPGYGPPPMGVPSTAPGAHGSGYGDIAAKQARAAEAFRHLDEDRNGYLDVSEFHRALNLLGVRMGAADAAAVFRMVDVGGDGRVSEREFVRYVDAAAVARCGVEAGVLWVWGDDWESRVACSALCLWAYRQGVSAADLSSRIAHPRSMSVDGRQLTLRSTCWRLCLYCGVALLAG